MKDLLIHSMGEFAPLILPVLECAGAREVVEIGSEFGGMSSILNEWVGARGGKLCCIDPHPKPEFLGWLARASATEHVARTSLEAMPELPCADAWLIDGDHNWYTVFHEVQAIFNKCRAAAKAALIFVHDVSWPCARRDMYYAPERVPANFRQLHTYYGGVMLGSAALVAQGGFRGNGQFACAYREGGAKNGVLTAVEDALADERARGGNLAWCLIPAVFGLGVIFDARASWSREVAQILAPWHHHPLLASIEENRLQNYLKVIELQEKVLHSG